MTSIGGRTQRRGRVIEILHLFVLSSFAVAQPVLAVLRETPSFFVTRRAEAADLFLLTVALVLLPPAAAGLIVLAADRAGARLGDLIHRGFVGLAFGLIALPLVSRTGIPWPAAAAGAALVAIAGALIYSGYRPFRQLVTFGTPAPIAFAALFLLTAPISQLFLPSQQTPLEGPPVDARAPVIFIILDELPVASLLDSEGAINRRRYPNFAAFADRASWFRNAVTISDSTHVMIPAILTGNRFMQGTLPTASDHPRNLFTFLSATYQIHAVEPFTYLCTPEVCETVVKSPPLVERVLALVDTGRLIYPRIVLPGLYEGSLPADDDVFGEFVNAPGELTAPRNRKEFQALQREAVKEQQGSDQVELFRTFIESIGPEERRLYFLHVFLPHGPDRYLPGGFSYESPGTPGRDGEVWVDEWLTFQAYQRHLLQLKRVDELVGDLTARLEQVGVFDEAAIVIMADHGASFRVGEENRKVTSSNIYDVGLIPLLIKGPGQQTGRVIDDPVRSIDVLPALAELLGEELPWDVDGISPFGGPLVEQAFPIRVVGGGYETLRDPVGGRVQATRHLLGLFGEGGGPFDLFAFGRYGIIVGTPSGGHRILGSSGIVADLKDGERFDSVNASSGMVPAFLEAELTDLGTGHDQVAVAVNDVVATVVPIYARDGTSGKITAMLPGHLFRDGRNTIEMFAVRGDVAAPLLTSIEIRGE